jgi:hypothetical protein
VLEERGFQLLLVNARQVKIHPKDRDDASNSADQQGRYVVDPLGDEDLVGRSRSGRRDLVPGEHLGAIALADALDQGLPFGKLLGRGRRRLDRPGHRPAHADGFAGPVVVVGSALVVVGSVVVVVGSVVVDSVLVVVASVVVVGALVVVGAVTGGWVVAPKVENPSVIVVAPAVAGVWAMAASAVVVGLRTTRGTVSGTASGVGVEKVGAVVGSWGAVVGVDAGLGAGSAGTVGSARAGARCGGGGWGTRVAEATRAARTPVVSPKATSPSLQGHRDVVWCRGGGVARCRGGGVDMVHCPGSTLAAGATLSPRTGTTQNAAAKQRKGPRQRRTGSSSTPGTGDDAVVVSLLLASWSWHGIMPNPTKGAKRRLSGAFDKVGRDQRTDP